MAVAEASRRRHAWLSMFARSLPAIVVALALLSPVAAQGRAEGSALYTTHCVACHQPDGDGVIGLAPPIAGTLGKRAATDEGLAYLAQVLVAGLSGPILSQGQRFNGVMPPMAAQPDDDLASIMNHVLERLNASSARLSPELINKARSRTFSSAELRQWREQLISRLGE